MYVDLDGDMLLWNGCSCVNHHHPTRHPFRVDGRVDGLRSHKTIHVYRGHTRRRRPHASRYFMSALKKGTLYVPTLGRVEYSSKSHEQPGDMERFVVVILVDPEMAQTTIKKRSWLVVHTGTNPA